MYHKQQPKIIILKHIPSRLHTSKRFNTVEIRRGMDAKVFKHLQENARKQAKWNSMAWQMEADAILSVDINVPKV